MNFFAIPIASSVYCSEVDRLLVAARFVDLLQKLNPAKREKMELLLIVFDDFVMENEDEERTALMRIEFTSIYFVADLYETIARISRN